MFYQFYDYIKNKYFDTLSLMTPPEREAEIFKKICEEMPISIKAGDLICGRYGCENDDFYKVNSERDFEYFDSFTAEEIKIKKELEEKYAIRLTFDRGHSLIDYEHIINFGLKSYVSKVKNELLCNDITSEKKTMLLSMLEAVEGVKIYMSRFSALAEKLFKETGNTTFLKMKNAMDKVPYEPSGNFYEAITAVWIMHSLIPASEDCWASISLGRFDKYMYPFYQNENNKEEIKKLIKNLFEFLNLYGDAACAFNIGGMSEEGEDEINELSFMLIEIEKELCMPSPIFAVRINKNTDDRVIDSLIDKKLFSVGQPTFYGEQSCRDALKDRGIPLCDLHKFSVNSCMGLYMSGEEIASMWGCMLNMYLPLEMAVNEGRPLRYKLPFEIKTKGVETPENKEQLLDLYENYLREICSVLFTLNRKNAQNVAKNKPNPLLSMLTENCIKSGLDRAIGAKYNTETIETMALVNTANAIVAIDDLVFQNKKYTLLQIIVAAQNDFDGYEGILADIKKCDKYGCGREKADLVSARLCKIVSDICKEESRDNVYFIPSLHTLASNVDFGNKLYTSLDGRKMGECVAKNAGPTNDVRGGSPTDILRSAATLLQKNFSGGQPVDLYFEAHMFESKEKRDKIKALVKTYFSMGGLQLQVNSVDLDILKKAYNDPENYGNIIVRIGGYSLPFVSLTKDEQREFIERFTYEKEHKWRE